MKHISVPIDQSCEFINLVPQSNPLISKCLIKVCYVDDSNPNRNMSVISKETAKKLARGLPGSPIVGFYNQDKKDFEEHSKILRLEDGEWKLSDLTRPYGFVDINAKVWFQKFLDDYQVEREYLVTEGYIWTGRYPEAERVIDKGNNQSMELDEKTLQGQWTKDSNEKPRFFIINDGLISALCILGEEEEPCFEGSQIKVNFSLDNTFYSMMEELKEICNKGGLSDMTQDNLTVEEVVEETVVQQEEEVVEETIVEENVEVEENFVDENGQEINDESEIVVEETVETYSLEEIPEYQTLLADYSALQESFNALQSQYSTLTEEVNELRTFKNGIDTQQKQAMIDSFYMLSAEDKQEVQDNIASYSLDEIESKLAVLCVRNKVSFNLENEEEVVTTFSINNDTVIEDSDVPGWCKAADRVQKELYK